VAKSEVSDKVLPPDPKQKWMFSHILAKGAYPGLEYCLENIALMTLKEHRLWENHKNQLIGLPEWKWVFERAEKLREDWGNGRMEGYSFFEG
jgi:hypothetical protein